MKDPSGATSNGVADALTALGAECVDDQVLSRRLAVDREASFDRPTGRKREVVRAGPAEPHSHRRGVGAIDGVARPFGRVRSIRPVRDRLVRARGHTHDPVAALPVGRRAEGVLTTACPGAVVAAQVDADVCERFAGGLVGDDPRQYAAHEPGDLADGSAGLAPKVEDFGVLLGASSLAQVSANSSSHCRGSRTVYRSAARPLIVHSPCLSEHSTCWPRADWSVRPKYALGQTPSCGAPWSSTTVPVRTRPSVRPMVGRVVTAWSVTVTGVAFASRDPRAEHKRRNGRVSKKQDNSPHLREPHFDATSKRIMMLGLHHAYDSHLR